MINPRDTLTRAEVDQMRHDKEMYVIQADNVLKMKEMELEVSKIEAKWSVLFKVPILLVKMPLFIVLGVAYCIAVAKDRTMPPEFWKLLK